MIKDAFFGIDQLTNEYGLKTKDVWYEAFDNASSKKEFLHKKNEKEWRAIKVKNRELYYLQYIVSKVEKQITLFIN